MQKITLCLWFDDNAEEAVDFYTSIFKNSKTGNIARYGEEGAKVSGRPKGTVMTVTFQIEGQEFMALNGGPIFKINPSVSFILNFDPLQDKNAAEKLDAIWEKLSPGGNVLMPLQDYPFSKRYGWIQDKYGISWQLILSNPDGEKRPFIVASFMFVGKVCGKTEEASDFYMSVFKNSKRGIVARYPKGMEPDKEGTVMFTDFMLNNQWFAAMDSARMHNFTFNEAISIVVNCKNQNEIDYYWEKLSDGGEEGPCGWLKDKYGLSWQIVPTVLGEMLQDKDTQKSESVMKAMLQMKKLDIETLESAYKQK